MKKPILGGVGDHKSSVPTLGLGWYEDRVLDDIVKKV